MVGCRKELPRITEVLFSYYSTKKIGVKDPINGLKAFKKRSYLKNWIL